MSDLAHSLLDVRGLSKHFGGIYALNDTTMAIRQGEVHALIGPNGAGKTTLIQFLWKLLGRDYEGFDPSKSTSAGRMRTFRRFSISPT